MPRKKKAICSMDDCNSVAKCSGMCTNCYNYVYYWLRKNSIKAIVQRMKNIERYKTRLRTLTGGKVAAMRPKRKRAA